MRKNFRVLGTVFALALAVTAGCAATGGNAQSSVTSEPQAETAVEQGNETAAGGQSGSGTQTESGNQAESGTQMGSGTQTESGNQAGSGTYTESASLTEKPVKDMAGRDIQVPDVVKSVYSTSPVGTNFMYTFDDRMVAGLNVDLSDEEKRFTTEYYQNLPNLGGWYGKGNEGNIEEIIKADPDLVLASGVDRSSIDTADQLQEKLGIPVVLIDTDFDSMAESYRFVGQITGNVERGEKLAAYTEETIQRAREITASIPEDKRVTVYYAEEALGLNTDPSGSPHSRLIDLCGGINVADCEISPGYGRTEVSMEQVIAWDPQFIIACVDNGFADSGSYSAIMNNSQWAVIRAVKDGHVYETPTVPQNWFDRPPSVNTIIGIKWVQNLLYPEYTDYDIKEETKAFYSLFYHYDLSDGEVDSLLARSLRAQ